jgi:hypothetical protein
MTPYWFKPKSYGYGATRVTWEGWAVTLAAIVVVAGSVFAMNLLVAQSNAVAWLYGPRSSRRLHGGSSNSAAGGPTVNGVGGGATARTRRESKSAYSSL